MAAEIGIVAGVIGLAGSAKSLCDFYRQCHYAPTDIQNWLPVLESLQSDLNCLKQIDSSPEATHHFSPDFALKLANCSKLLDPLITKVKKAKAGLGGNDPDGNSPDGNGPDGNGPDGNGPDGNGPDKNHPGSKNKLAKAGKRLLSKVNWEMEVKNEIRNVVEVVNMYQFGFLMELLKLFLYVDELNFDV